MFVVVPTTVTAISTILTLFVAAVTTVVTILVAVVPSIGLRCILEGLDENVEWVRLIFDTTETNRDFRLVRDGSFCRPTTKGNLLQVAILNVLYKWCQPMRSRFRLVI